MQRICLWQAFALSFKSTIVFRANGIWLSMVNNPIRIYDYFEQKSKNFYHHHSGLVCLNIKSFNAIFGSRFSNKIS
jgi:hypothetical protein